MKQLIIYCSLIILLISAASMPNLQQSQLYKEKFIECTRIIYPRNKTLVRDIKMYLLYIKSNEIPIVAIEQKNDSVHYFISAFISTNSIKKNPPSEVIRFINREALLYTGKSSLTQTNYSCYKSLLTKYHKILRIDLINERDGIDADNPKAYSYDPISADIAVSRDGHVVANSNGDFPHIK